MMKLQVFLLFAGQCVWLGASSDVMRSQTGGTDELERPTFQHTAALAAVQSEHGTHQYHEATAEDYHLHESELKGSGDELVQGDKEKAKGLGDEGGGEKAKGLGDEGGGEKAEELGDEVGGEKAKELTEELVGEGSVENVKEVGEESVDEGIGENGTELKIAVDSEGSLDQEDTAQVYIVEQRPELNPENPPSGEMALVDGSQGHGTVKFNHWTQGGGNWKGVRGKRQMCFSGDPFTSYLFAIRLDGGSHHQVGVANDMCCKGKATSNSKPTDSYACLYSHHTGWDRYRGAALPVGSPDKSTWWASTWDGGNKVVLINVSCTKKTFTVALEGGDDFLGEMSWPSSWESVFAFGGQHSSNANYRFEWRSAVTPLKVGGPICFGKEVGTRAKPFQCDEQPASKCKAMYTVSREGRRIWCGVSGANCAAVGGLCETTTTTTNVHPTGDLKLMDGSQGSGTVNGNEWRQANHHWKGVRGQDKMCFRGDHVKDYYFKVKIERGSHHQVGVANKACCQGIATSNSNDNDNYADFYSHTNGWKSHRGAAKPVGNPSQSTWWSGTWDSAGKTMTIHVSCEHHSFTLGQEGGKDFMGEMKYPESWDAVYAFIGHQGHHMIAKFTWMEPPAKEEAAAEEEAW